jgi:hypothetical protein
MTISSEDFDILRKAGFVEYELEQIANAKTPDGKDQPPIDINSPAWRAVIKSRREWTDDKIARGWQLDAIINEVMNYYHKDERRTPFDFLKAEYRPRKRVDYYAVVRERKKIAIEEDMGEYVGLSPEGRPSQMSKFTPETREAFRRLQEGLYGEQEENK